MSYVWPDLGFILAPHGSIAPIFYFIFKPKSDCVREARYTFGGALIVVHIYHHQPVKNTRPLSLFFFLDRRGFPTYCHVAILFVSLSHFRRIAQLYLYIQQQYYNNNNDDDIAALHIFGLCYYCLECWSAFYDSEVELLRLT